LHEVLLEVCTIICLGVYRHLVSGHEKSRLQHGLQSIMARFTTMRYVNLRFTYLLTYLHSHNQQ